MLRCYYGLPKTHFPGLYCPPGDDFFGMALPDLRPPEESKN